MSNLPIKREMGNDLPINTASMFIWYFNPVEPKKLSPSKSSSHPEHVLFDGIDIFTYFYTLLLLYSKAISQYGTDQIIALLIAGTVAWGEINSFETKQHKW